MGKSHKRHTPGTGVKRDVRKEAERSLRRNVKHKLKLGYYNSLPEQSRLDKDDGKGE